MPIAMRNAFNYGHYLTCQRGEKKKYELIVEKCILVLCLYSRGSLEWLPVGTVAKMLIHILAELEEKIDTMTDDVELHPVAS